MNPYLGEIQAFAFGYAPPGWAICDGSTLLIRSNVALFSLIGNYYGGNGTTTFNLPNLVGQVVIGQGQGPGFPNYVVGQQVGENTVTLTSSEMPAHNHGMQLGAANSPNATPGPTGGSNVAISPGNAFVAPPGNTTFSPTTIVSAGKSQSHPNAQPTLAMLYCICLQGDFPNFG